ncbi:MAG: phage holin family protein, partial [Desulfobacterales bacterium]|nr:phage holin family protein [Desulfobacterales bacterium]
MHLILNIIVLSVAIFFVAQLLPGIYLKNYGTAIIVAIVYSLISSLISWFLVFITLPLMVLTFGLFKFVINAALLWVTDQFIEDFKIENF